MRTVGCPTLGDLIKDLTRDPTIRPWGWSTFLWEPLLPSPMGLAPTISGWRWRRRSSTCSLRPTWPSLPQTWYPGLPLTTRRPTSSTVSSSRPPSSSPPHQPPPPPRPPSTTRRRRSSRTAARSSSWSWRSARCRYQSQNNNNNPPLPTQRMSVCQKKARWMWNSSLNFSPKIFSISIPCPSFVSRRNCLSDGLDLTLV